MNLNYIIHFNFNHMFAQTDRNNLAAAFYILSAVFFILITVDWVLFTELHKQLHFNVPSLILTFFGKMGKEMIIYRVFYCGALCGAFAMSPSFKKNKGDKQENRPYIHAISILLVGLTIFGYQFNAFYALYIYPIVFFTLLHFLSKSINTLRDNIPATPDGKVSCEPENDMSFEFKTEQGLLRVHKPQQGVLVSGGAGAGKTASILESAQNQMIQKGFAGVIYDFKGNPPTLGLSAYNAIETRNSNLKKDEIPTKFGIINFSDLNQTVRCNPLHPKYIHNSSMIKEASILIMFSVNKSWVKNKDFWADNAISLLTAVIKMLRDNHPEQCSLPHAISAILQDGDTLLNWLQSDPNVAVEAMPAITAFKNKAEGQIAGSISSVQLPMTILRSEELFWVLSADEFDLDLNNKKNPKVLCVANNPVIKKALAPAIGLIIKTCMNSMNQQGKNKSFLMMDEFPQIFIPEIYDFPATARSNKCVTFLAFQLYSQLVEEYGEQQARSIIGNLGTQFHGMTNDLQLAEMIAKLFGDKKYADFSYSESDSGLSQTESQKKEAMYQIRDVMGQDTGHFMGKIASGKPPLFNAQFPEYKNPNTKEIPDFALDSLPVKTGDISLDKKIHAHRVKANFDRINAEINTIMDPYRVLITPTTILI